MGALHTLLNRELADPEFDLLETLRRADNWATAAVEALSILEDRSLANLWQSATCVLYWTPPGTPLPAPNLAIVARLYCCLETDLPADGGIDANLVWSLSIDLKGVGYESDWEPILDPEVLRYLTEMRRVRDSLATDLEVPG